MGCFSLLDLFPVLRWIFNSTASLRFHQSLVGLPVGFLKEHQVKLRHVQMATTSSVRCKQQRCSRPISSHKWPSGWRSDHKMQSLASQARNGWRHHQTQGSYARPSIYHPLYRFLTSITSWLYGGHFSSPEHAFLIRIWLVVSNTVRTAREPVESGLHGCASRGSQSDGGVNLQFT